MKNLMKLILATGLAVALNSTGMGSAGTHPAFGPLSSKPQSSNAGRWEERTLRLPLAGQAKVSATLGRADGGYRVEAHRTLEVRNPIRALRADFGREGVRVV